MNIICISLKQLDCLNSFYVFFSEIYKIKKNDIILILINIIFFIFIQMIFFNYVVSNLYETLLIDKINFVKTLEDNNSNIKSLINNIKTNFIEHYKNNTHDTIEYFNLIKSQREKINNNLTLLYGGIPIFVLCFILLCFFIKNYIQYRNNLKIKETEVCQDNSTISNNNLFIVNEWNLEHTFGLILIILSYTVEVILFFCIISQYEFIGDNYLIYNFLKNVLY